MQRRSAGAFPRAGNFTILQLWNPYHTQKSSKIGGVQRRALLTLATQAGLAATASASLRRPGLLPRFLGASAEPEAQPSTALPRTLAHPSPEQKAWQNLEMGMFLHFGPRTWQNGAMAAQPTPLSAMNPHLLDTDQWAQTALDLGAKYIVFVAKHQEGFCWWPTETTGYSIRNIPWRNGTGDMVGMISESCRRHGLQFGLYVSPRDDHFGAATGGICKTAAEQRRYNQIYRRQLTEVFTRYGPLVEIWFDGSTATPTGDLIRKYQPHAMIFQGRHATIRWVGNELGLAPYPCWNGIDRADAATGTATSLDGDPNGSVWLPNEVDVSIRRPHWFWRPEGETVLTEDQLLSIYYRSIGRGAQLLLNIPANTAGLLPQEDCQVAKLFGDEVRRRFSRPVARTSGRGSTLTLNLPRGSRVDTVVMQEDTTYGERIRAYRLEGLSAGQWITLGEGSAVGHKRIQPISADASSGQMTAIRLSVTHSSAAPPVIRSLAAFNTGVAPPADWNAPAMVWAANLAGGWSNHQFSLDITHRVQSAGQYRLRFVPLTGAITGLRDVVLSLHGISEPGLCRLAPGHPDEILLDITGTRESSVKISGFVEGAFQGQILLQKL